MVRKEETKLPALTTKSTSMTVASESTNAKKTNGPGGLGSNKFNSSIEVGSNINNTIKTPEVE